MNRTASLWIVACCALVLCGCSSEPIFNGKANQVNLQTYAQALERKYTQAGELEADIKTFNEMAEERSELQRKARERDADQIKVLSNTVQQLDGELEKRKANQRDIQTQLRHVDTQIASLQAKALSKPNDAAVAGSLADAKDRKADLAAMLEVATGDVAALTEKRTTNQQKLIALIDKDYSDEGDRERREFRNRIIHELLAIADSHYYAFKSSLLTGRAGGDTAMDITELALSTATTLVGGVTAKGNLGAASTLLKGSRTSIDKNFFVQQTLSSIINGIEDKRQTDLLSIEKKLRTSTDDYPLTQGLSDVELYQSRASLIDGAMAVANQTAAKATQSARELNTQLETKSH